MKLAPTTIPQRLSYTSSCHPDRAAIVSESGDVLSFFELKEQIEYSVSQLNRCGISRNDRVAIVLPQSPELAVAFLAVSSGATAAPLNHAYKKEDFLFYLSDLGVRALILQAGDETAAREAASELNIPILELKVTVEANGRFELLGDSAQAVGEGGFSEAGDVALVLHTSGTTSRPKMVPLTQTNLCHSASNIIVTLGLNDKDCCLNLMPLFHIHGLVACVLASLFSGGKTICTTGFNLQSFFNCLKKYCPSWYSAVPTMHQAVLGAVRNGEKVNSSLRLIRSSSAALPPTVMEELEQVFSVPVIESYGMTEAAHQMASNPLPPMVRKPGSVGIAAGLEICILNESDEVLETGDIGEICIRGANVTPGYENHAEANAESFTQEGWFRTGDQGYLDPEGYLFLTGRLKEMINRGGENIAPREIDEALLEHPEVRQAVGFAIPHESLGEDVVAAVTLAEGSELNDSQLRSHAMEKLADFKVPSRILILEDIPKGPTGKLQRMNLADALSEEISVVYEAPETETERMICTIIEKILGVAKVGRSDNFFLLGGDSLRAAQVINRINSQLSVECSAVELFRHPSPFLLAQHIESIRNDQEIEDLANALEELSEDERQQLLEEDNSTT